MLATCLALAPMQVAADGPALAHLTLAGRTITLTADASIPAPDMPHISGDTLDLHFAQRHLGFPIPPVLTLSMVTMNGTWSLTALELRDTSTVQPTVFAPAAMAVEQVGDGSHHLSFRISGEAMVPNGRPLPVLIEITLTSP